MRTRSTLGLTLVEILVVVVIISVLGVLLFAILAGARERANVATDISNLHQIGLSAEMYSSDFDQVRALSLKPLIDNGNLIKPICASPADSTAEGLTWRFRQDTINANVGMVEQINARCSYVGPGDGNWGEEHFKASIEQKPNAGWLVNLARTNNEHGKQKVGLGRYQRLTLSGSVLTRYYGYTSLFIEGISYDKVITFEEYFHDK